MSAAERMVQSRFERPKRKPGDVPSIEEIRREALESIRRLDRKTLPKPKAIPELWPGGPSVDTGDIRLARRKQRGGSVSA